MREMGIFRIRLYKSLQLLSSPILHFNNIINLIEDKIDQGSRLNEFWSHTISETVFYGHVESRIIILYRLA